MYIDNLDEVVNKDNNTCYRTIKMKPVHVNPGTRFDFNKENNRVQNVKLAIM